MTGILYIVATPIGNLEDITLRALNTLRIVDVIAAEDTRHSIKLLNHYQIAKPLISYWGEKEKTKSEEVLSRLRSGQSVALISDAGTPGISDPGAVLINKALDEGLEVVPIPGPSAVTAALSVSGLDTDEFTFIGFLPAKVSHRRKKLEDLRLEPRTLVFFEAPHRILETLDDISEILGDRLAVLASEVTKLHEAIFRGSPEEILRKTEQSTIAGEYVIAVEGKKSVKQPASEDALKEIKSLMKKGLGRKDAVKRVAAAYCVSKKELYDRSLAGE